MTSPNVRRLEEFQKQIVEQLAATNAKLDKIAALLLSNQLLEECISPDGEIRTAEECADIVRESFCASLCLSQELNSNQKDFQYQVSEFYLDSDEDEEDEDDGDEYEDEEDDDDDDGGTVNYSMSF